VCSVAHTAEVFVRFLDDCVENILQASVAFTNVPRRVLMTVFFKLAAHM
jgi:hypothetical protein